MTSPQPLSPGHTLAAREPLFLLAEEHRTRTWHEAFDEQRRGTICGVCDALNELRAARSEGVPVDLREALAAIEHEQWMAWSQDLASKELLTGDRLARWKDLWVPYTELPEEMKDHDRVWADKVRATLSSAGVTPEPRNHSIPTDYIVEPENRAGVTDDSLRAALSETVATLTDVFPLIPEGDDWRGSVEDTLKHARRALQEQQPEP